MTDLVIEGDAESLEWIRREIESRVGADADLEPGYAVSGGNFNEPMLISLIVALGGPAIVLAVRDVLARRYTHIERMRELEIAAGRPPGAALTLSLNDDGSERPVELAELTP